MTTNNDNGQHLWELAIEVYIEAALMNVPTVSSMRDGERHFGLLDV